MNLTIQEIAASRGRQILCTDKDYQCQDLTAGR